MKIIHYHFVPKGATLHFWRWRIEDDEGRVICRGVTTHKLRDDSLQELNEVLDFLEEWSRERRQFGGF